MVCFIGLELERGSHKNISLSSFQCQHLKGRGRWSSESSRPAKAEQWNLVNFKKKKKRLIKTWAHSYTLKKILFQVSSVIQVNALELGFKKTSQDNLNKTTILNAQNYFWRKEVLKKTTPTEQMNILYLGRLEFPLFVQMEKKSDALVVLLENKNNTRKRIHSIKKKPIDTKLFSLS